MDSRQRFTLRDRRNIVVAALALVVILVATVAVVAMVRGANNKSTSATNKSRCGQSGCALVSMTRSAPRTTVLYGASCSGVYGSWFFNAVEGGPNTDLRPSYSLHWTFTQDSTTAKPTGSVAIAPTDDAQVAMTLSDGILSVSGTRKPDKKVMATGNLTVALTGTSTAPTLTFTESGLTDAEKALGLDSPFNVDGHPLEVPVKSVKTLGGC
jgi:hypothetical protein